MIFLGYPNWNSDLPMPLYTFLETYDFSGKTILPFTAHGGSRLLPDGADHCGPAPGATVVEDGLAISRNDVPPGPRSGVPMGGGTHPLTCLYREGGERGCNRKP